MDRSGKHDPEPEPGAAGRLRFDPGSPPPPLLARIVQGSVQLAAATPLGYLSYMLWRTWTDPLSLDAEVWVPFGTVILLIEFVLLHSGVFMAVFAAKAKRWYVKGVLLGGLALFYSVFAVAIAFATHSVEALEVFGLVLLGRFVALLLGGGGGPAVLARSGCGAIVFLFLIFMVAMLPWPRLGMTSEVVSTYLDDDASGFAPDAHAFVAAAMIYFALMTFVEAAMAVGTFRGTKQHATLDPASL